MEEVRNVVNANGCGRNLPFEFSNSEGGLAAAKAAYRELVDIGFDEDSLKVFEDRYMMKLLEEYLQERRENMAKGDSSDTKK